MLKKLMKYDFKTLSNALLPIYLISLILSVIARITSELTEKIAILRIPSNFILTLSVLTSIGIVFATFIVGIMKFYNSMVKDEGYLTHTLPVKKSNLILSKLITMSLFQIVSLLISFVTLYISLKLNETEIFKMVKDLITEIVRYNNWIVLLMILSFIFGYINNILLMYTSISLGQKHNSNKLVYSVIYGIVIYNISQIISVIFLVPLMFNDYIMTELEKQIPESSVLNLVLLISIFITIVMSVIYFIITKKMLEKKLNLE